MLGGGPVALAIARSLGGAGISVHALGHSEEPVRHSRFCSSFSDFETGGNVQSLWLEWLERGPSGAVLLAGSDHGLELVARNRRALLDLDYVPFEADDEVLLAMLDKKATHELAVRSGIPVPATVTVAHPEDIEAALEAVGSPCVLKPLHSHRFAEHFGMHQKVFVFRDARHARDLLARTSALGLEMLLTAVVVGDDECVSYYSYLDEAGAPLLHFTKRKLRQYPTRFGLGCYHATDWNPEVAELGLRFFEGVGLRGIGNVEFKRDIRDGQLKLIECNHRFTAATELVTASGLDLPLFTYARLLGREGPRVDRYRTGLRLWYPIEDSRAFLAYRRAGELTVRGWLRSLWRRQHFPVARLDDPLPSLVGLVRLIWRRTRKTWSGSRGRH